MNNGYGIDLAAFSLDTLREYLAHSDLLPGPRPNGITPTTPRLARAARVGWAGAEVRSAAAAGASAWG